MSRYAPRLGRGTVWAAILLGTSVAWCLPAVRAVQPPLPPFPALPQNAPADSPLPQNPAPQSEPLPPAAQAAPTAQTPATAPAAPSGQTPTETPAESSTATVDQLLQQVAQRQQQLQADAERPAEEKERLTKLYEALRVDLEAVQQARQRRQEYVAAAAAAPAAVAQARSRQTELESKQPAADRDAISSSSYEELDQRRAELEAELETVTAERTTLTDRIAQREKRRKELPQLISDARAKLEALEAQPVPPAGNADVPLTQEANDWSRQVSRQLLTEQQQGYEAEQRLYESEAELLPLKLNNAQTSEKRLQESLRLVNERLDQLRSDRLQNTYLQAQRLSRAASPGLKPVGEALLESLEAWMALARRQADVQQDRDAARGLLTRWSERRKQMVARVEPTPGAEGVSTVISGFNSWVGLMLRKQRGELPDTQQLQAKIRGYQMQMQAAESLLFDIEDALQEIRLREDMLDQRAAVDAAGELPPEAAVDSQLLEFSADALQAMTLEVNAYQDDLYELADIHENIIRLTRSYREFIDRHVLWIRSAEPLSSGDWRPGMEAFRWLVKLENWSALAASLGQDVRHRPGWYVLFVLGMLLLIANQTRLRRQLADISAKAEKNNCVNYRLTARSLVLTLLLSAPLPLILLFFHWRLSAATGPIDPAWVGGEFRVSLASGLWIAAIVFGPLELIRQLCRPAGLGMKHFNWNAEVSLRVRTNLRWFIDFCVPLALLIGMFINHPVERWDGALGRAGFILVMPLLSLFFGRVLAPRSGIVSHFLEHHRGGWLDRLSWLWYPAHLAYPLALAAVSYIGYHYTAIRIASHMVATLWMLVLLWVAYSMLMRWLVISRRRLMLAQARQRLEEAARREPQQADGPVAVEEPRVNLVAINEQTRRLVSSLTVALGLVWLFVIWADVLPAVSMLDNVRLWPIYGSITEETFTISLSSVLLLIPLIVLVIIAGRNVPGLLEIAFLQHLPLTSAARYAITTVSRYAIFGFGIVAGASMIGLQWNSIQWLVAALGVGLGFGLQEIFANFVSGIILLFEQPIRVGDIISIDGTTGTVNRIRMRATTIVNWDRQELVVPNKDLITGKLLNWTLTDTTNRVVINIGVAYGSDTRQACDLILQTCLEDERLVRDPLPTVTFEGFGDNSLNLVMRAFLDSLDSRLTVISQLHHRIYQVLNEAGIEIAFPQRDLHIRSLPEKWNRWLERHS